MAWEYRAKLLEQAPRWVSGVLGTQLWALFTSIGEELDKVGYYVRWAFRCYFLTRCPDDLLNLWGIERKLPLFPGETLASHRARLIAAPSFYRKLGTSLSTVETFALLGYTARVITNKDWPVTTWDDPGTDWDDPESSWDSGGPPDLDFGFWNRIWVEVDVTWEPDDWDSLYTNWDDAASNWDALGISAAEVEHMKALVLRTRSCYNLFVALIFNPPSGNKAFLVMGESGE